MHIEPILPHFPTYDPNQLQKNNDEVIYLVI